MGDMLWKRFKILFGVIAFVVGGIWMLLGDFPTSRYPEWFYRFWGLVCLLFFGGGGIVLTRRWILNREYLKFDDKGIIIN